MKARVKHHHLITKQRAFARLKALKGCLLPDMLNGLKTCLVCQVPTRAAMEIADELAGWGITPLCWKSAIKQKAFVGWEEHQTAIWFHTWQYPGNKREHYRVLVYRNAQGKIILNTQKQVRFFTSGGR